MRQKDPALSHEMAIDEYYGGVKGLSSSSIPFKCKCGGTTYKDRETGEDMPVMHIEDTFKHIRTKHNERIKKYKNAV